MLNKPDVLSFDNINHVGIALSDNNGQSHIGILYKKNGVVFLLHLASWKDLRNEKPKSSYRWLQANFDIYNLKLIAAQLKRLSNKLEGAKIPYGFHYDDNRYVSPEDGYIRTSLDDGLTCATFVLSVFDSLEFPLLVTEEWISNSIDTEWQKNIIPFLGVSDEIARVIAKKIGSPRFKPEEVAAGAISDKKPLSFVDAKNLGSEIKKELVASY